MTIGDAAAQTTQPSSPTVACAGQVVADLFVPPLPALPAAGELLTTGDMLSGVGGCSANAAAVLARFGVPTVLSAMVGADGQGDWVRRSLAEQGIDVRGVETSPTLATSQTVILPVVGEDRRYIHSIGANAEYRAADALSYAGRVEVLVVSGFLSLPGLRTEEVADLFGRARAAGTRTILDVVIPSGTEHVTEKIRPVLPFVDCFTPNDDEGAACTGEVDPVRQATTLVGWGCRSVVITRGEHGAIYADPERIVQVLPLPVRFVDGSGAGDAFVAGYVYGLVQDWPVERRLRFAAAVGASVTRGLGTRSTLFSLDEALTALDDVALIDVAVA